MAFNLPLGEAIWGLLYKSRFSRKLILGEWFQENMISRRPFLLLRISDLLMPLSSSFHLSSRSDARIDVPYTPPRNQLQGYGLWLRKEGLRGAAECRDFSARLRDSSTPLALGTLGRPAQEPRCPSRKLSKHPTTINGGEEGARSVSKRRKGVGIDRQGREGESVFSRLTVA